RPVHKDRCPPRTISPGKNPADRSLARRRLRHPDLPDHGGREMKSLFYGLMPVCRKEFTHIVRDPGTLFFALLIPLIQLLLFGFAVDTNVRQIPTVVLDESHTQQSRQLLESFA